MLVGREAETCFTNIIANSWFSVDLGSANAIRPTHYTLRHYIGERGYGGAALRNWELQGSADGAFWTTLRRHVDDVGLADVAGATATWSLESDRAWRHLRVMQTGPNSSGNNFLCLSGLEVYGAIIDNASQ